MTAEILALCAAFFLAGMRLGEWLERRRSPRQSVAGSSTGQSVVAAAAAPSATKIDELPARALTAAEQAEWDKKQKKRILAKLQQDFPTMGEGKRNAAADELLARARSLLARVS